MNIANVSRPPTATRLGPLPAIALYGATGAARFVQSIASGEVQTSPSSVVSAKRSPVQVIEIGYCGPLRAVQWTPSGETRVPASKSVTTNLPPSQAMALG